MEGVVPCVNFLRIIAGPLVGGVIGLLTNYLAVRMLFRPYEAVYIGRWHVPFTPGIVARRKEELAVMLGTSIVRKFFNSDDLVEVFTSDYLTAAFADKLTEALERRDVTLREALGGGPDLAALKDELCVRIQGGLLRADLPRLLAQEARRGRGRTGELAAALVGELGGEIEDYILHRSRAAILPLLDEELEELLDRPVGELTGLAFPESGELHAALAGLYGRFMARAVGHITSSIDVGGMITEKVHAMTPQEIEGLVLSVVSRELRYVVYLGGAIGALIGIVNSFL